MSVPPPPRLWCEFSRLSYCASPVHCGPGPRPVPFPDSHRRDRQPSLLTFQVHQTSQEKLCTNHMVRTFPKMSQVPGTFSFPSSVSNLLSTLPRFLTYPTSENSSWWIKGDMQGSGSFILLLNAPNLCLSSPAEWLVHLRIADQLAHAYLHNSMRWTVGFLKLAHMLNFSIFIALTRLTS